MILSAFNLFHLIIILCVLYVTAYAQGDDGAFETNNDELIFAHILFRHGERNILHESYENDPYKDEKYWLPDGFGQLTITGKKQMFELGKYLRRRYSKFVSNDGSRNAEKIYVQSTNVRRTIQSAAYTLAAMLNKQSVWNDLLVPQTEIPIHVLKSDTTLSMKKPCPLYKEAYEEYKQSPEIKQIVHDYQWLLQYLEKHTGESVRNIHHIKSIYDTLWIESLKNFTLPEWTKEVFVANGDMERLTGFYFSMPTNTKQLARLRVGFLIREIFEHFTMKIDGKLTPDLWIYSAHDSTVASVLNALGLAEPHIPDFASCVFLELHKINGNFHIEIFHKRERGEDKVPLKPLVIPNCGRKCPLHRIKEIYRDILPTEDFDTECDVDQWGVDPLFELFDLFT